MWKKLLGAGREDRWRDFCDRVGGELVYGRRWDKPAVLARANGWLVVLDVVRLPLIPGRPGTIYTRMRTPFIRLDDLSFEVSRRYLLSGLSRLLGAQDIRVGDGVFDRQFIVRSNQPGKVRALFANQSVRELLQVQAEGVFQVKDEGNWFRIPLPTGMAELSFYEVNVQTDVEQLFARYALLAETLLQLHAIGSAACEVPCFPF